MKADCIGCQIGFILEQYRATGQYNSAVEFSAESSASIYTAFIGVLQDLITNWGITKYWAVKNHVFVNAW